MKLLLFILAITSLSFAGEYHVDRSAKKLVKFISDAPIEDFEGITNKIDGFIYWEDEDLLKNSEFYFEVDLNSIDTGIGLRNRHMRENYLHTEKFPKAYFKGKLISADKKDDNGYEVTAKGLFYVHGIEKEKSVTGKITETNQNMYKISVQFVVPLSDHDIDIPSIMFYKIDENMDLIVEFSVKKVLENNGEKK